MRKRSTSLDTIVSLSFECRNPEVTPQRKNLIDCTTKPSKHDPLGQEIVPCAGEHETSMFRPFPFPWPWFKDPDEWRTHPCRLARPHGHAVFGHRPDSTPGWRTERSGPQHGSDKQCPRDEEGHSAHRSERTEPALDQSDREQAARVIDVILDAGWPPSKTLSRQAEGFLRRSDHLERHERARGRGETGLRRRMDHAPARVDARG